jgi:hypothetical protein
MRVDIDTARRSIGSQWSIQRNRLRGPGLCADVAEWQLAIAAVVKKISATARKTGRLRRTEYQERTLSRTS